MACNLGARVTHARKYEGVRARFLPDVLPTLFISLAGKHEKSPTRPASIRSLVAGGTYDSAKWEGGERRSIFVDEAVDFGAVTIDSRAGLVRDRTIHSRVGRYEILNEELDDERADRGRNGYMSVIDHPLARISSEVDNSCLGNQLRASVPRLSLLKKEITYTMFIARFRECF